MAKRYTIKLTDNERAELERLTRTNKTGAKKFIRARALLLADNGPDGPGWSNARIAEALGVTSRTVENTKKRLVKHDITAAIERKKREVPPIEPMFDGKKEAQLIALACSEPPEGHKRWTVRLLADELVQQEIFDNISKSSVQNTLKKMNLSLT